MNTFERWLIHKHHDELKGALHAVFAEWCCHLPADDIAWDHWAYAVAMEMTGEARDEP